ncbi:UDP-N-acetylmuramoyl-tripeptide--D-alanyl-D-alanine ligase [Pontimicrobium sp. SW4]|uniref:UDP-N-acetylmuramoyl-tripeptide--D-alanyl-D-alanine ligase n=1 Tax=Pontimicrobium sp. SW4 TaxID=3153519 RepID=A0AAU7BUN6_9FLAO
MKIEALHKLFLKHTTVCTDTRKITKNCLFFALKGENFNGNAFAKSAIEKGAKYAIVDEKEVALNQNYILVENVLKTLQELANYHRHFLGLKIVALTGSNGKTTTKELINSVLSKKYKTTATVGNLNNHIGVPLTLLSMDSATQIGIVEMGANHQKEIEFLCAITQPDYGYITNFGKAHLEGFGSIEGVIKGKSELYNHLKANERLIFINDNDETQLKQLNDYKNSYSFGNNTSNCNIELVEANPFVIVKYNNETIESQLIGSYNFNNISAAIAIGNYFGVTTIHIKKAIESYIPENNRSQIIQKGSNKIILDAYNANPTSMKAALDNFNQLNAKYKIAILGDMFELGKETRMEHEHIANYANNLNINKVFLVGNNFYDTKFKSSKVVLYKTFDDLKSELNVSKLKNATILIKGSRGMALERVLEIL